MARGNTPDWTEEEFQDLAMTIISVMQNGGTMSDGIREFVAKSEFRSESATRYKTVTIITKQYGEAIERAREVGHGKTYIPSKAVQEAYGLEVADDGVKSKSNTMKKNDLIRLLRETTILDGDDHEETIKQLQRELDEAKRARANAEKEVLLWKAKYEESEAELQPLLQAMNIARRRAANIDDDKPAARIVIGRDGEVERVER